MTIKKNLLRCFILQHKKNTNHPVDIIPLKQNNLRRAGLYFRAKDINEDNQFVDCFDDKPFSTEFSFTRFLVPF